MAKPTGDAYRLFLAQLSRWPSDPLRPNTPFVPAMKRRLDRLQGERGDTKGEAEMRKETQALGFLLDDRFAKKYRLSDRIWHPQYNPKYFVDILNDLEATQSRTWFQSRWIRLKGLVRLHD